ncbi:MAG: pentapeptide repeat-containing protein, partial [Polaribacter sp.]
EYDNCTFKDCNFESIHASNIQFVECEFIDCNFSNTIVKDSAFKDVNFINCKMIGVKFNECDPFLLQFSFKDCQLNFSSFYKLKIPNTKFVNCNLEEVDFTETNLTSVVLDNCDLKNTIFDSTNIEKSDFRSSFNFEMNPEENRLKGAKFSRNSVDGLLSKYKIIIE